MAQETVPAKQEAAQSPAERTHTRPTFSPRVDIYERGDAMVLLADMPGVNESTLDVRLEEGVLTIKGRVEPPSREGRRSVWAKTCTARSRPKHEKTYGGQFHEAHGLYTS